MQPLRELERSGFVTRTVTAPVPLRADYAAPALGRALIRKIHPLWL
ncbi:MAG: winged helix-turn-helix transcriptional regulator [Xanthobacteraceae bacterium]